MNTLYAATAVIEAGAGLALLSLPSTAVDLLLGTPLETTAALTVARIGGAALFTLGTAFWLARGDTQSPASRGLVAAMVLYNLGAVFILSAAGIRSRSVGVALWPAAVVLHAVMAIWCIMSLRYLSLGEGLGNPGSRRSKGERLAADNRPMTGN